MKLIFLGLFLLGVGFAAVSTTLYMDGNVEIAKNEADYDVKITNATLDGVNVSSSAILNSGNTISYAADNLSTVGDISKLNFEITNNSEMYDADARLECTVEGAASDCYQITEPALIPIAGKSKIEGKLEVKLLKIPDVDVQEIVTCTLETTPKERTTKAK